MKRTMFVGWVVAMSLIKPFPTADWQQFTIPLTACYFRLGNKGGLPGSAQDFAAVL